MKTKPKIWTKLIMVIIMVLYFVPFYILITVSLKNQTDLSTRWALPNYFNLDNFASAWQNANLARAFFNDLIITGLVILLLIIVGSLSSYPLARYRSKLNKTMYMVFISAMVIPPLSILVPLYKFYAGIGAMDTYWGIILLHLTFQLPITIFLYTGFISTLPRELDEAALIDGCTRFSVFFKILFPLLKPITATVIIMTGINVWNDYQFSIFFLQQTDMKTITVALSSFFGSTTNHISWVAAGSLLGSLPMIAVYLFLQKYFVSGLSAGAVKG